MAWGVAGLQARARALRVVPPSRHPPLPSLLLGTIWWIWGVVAAFARDTNTLLRSIRATSQLRLE